MTRNLEGEDPPETPASQEGYGREVSPFRPSRRPVLHRLVPVSRHLPRSCGGTLRRHAAA
jgi:hypothetical protein